MYIYIYIDIYIYTYIYIYIHVYIFTGPLALGVLDHSRVTEVDLSTDINPPYSPPWGCPGAKSRCAVDKLWLSCG